MIILLMITSFPPLFGYGTLLTLCGFIFRFPLGVIPAYLGGLLGSTACFIVSRKWLVDYYRENYLKNIPEFTAIEEAINKGNDSFSKFF